MKLWLFLLGIVAASGLTLVSGVLHGRLSNRWGPSPEVVAAASKLEEIPRQFANWRLRSTDELDEFSLNELNPAGYIVRTYENQKTGDVVGVTLLLGAPGPMSVHTPEVCFASRNYQSRSERRRVAIPRKAGSDDEFWALDYKTDDLRGDLLRVYYGWSTGGRWLAAKDARFTFVGQPYLYKIQLSSALQPGADAQSRDPCREFLKDFVPLASAYLIEPSVKK